MLAANKRRDPNRQPALHLPAPIDEPTADAWPVALASDSSWTTFPNRRANVGPDQSYYGFQIEE
jgi:hypothetical protein